MVPWEAQAKVLCRYFWSCPCVAKEDFEAKLRELGLQTEPQRVSRMIRLLNEKLDAMGVEIEVTTHALTSEVWYTMKKQHVTKSEALVLQLPAPLRDADFLRAVLLKILKSTDGFVSGEDSVTLKDGTVVDGEECQRRFLNLTLEGWFTTHRDDFKFTYGPRVQAELRDTRVMQCLTKEAQQHEFDATQVEEDEENDWECPVCSNLVMTQSNCGGAHCTYRPCLPSLPSFPAFPAFLPAFLPCLSSLPSFPAFCTSLLFR
ncbi:MAG: hypothetical protein MHM6MM_006932 [Cercozoa sp. M6MM]